MTIKCDCGRLYSKPTVWPIRCFCGRVKWESDDAPPQPNRIRPGINYRPLESYINEVIGCGCNSTDLVEIANRTGVEESRIEALLETAKELYSRQFNNTAVVTFHWNPSKFKRLRETFYEWYATVPHPITCYELVIGDEEPEIEGSVAIRGAEKNILWQKERLINLAVKNLPPEIKFVAWVDHDLIFENVNWLKDSISLLESGIDALQPFSKLTYLNRDGSVSTTAQSATATMKEGKKPHTGPGGAWVARRDFLNRIGGVYDRNVVGGGDAVWFSGLSKLPTTFLQRQPEAAAVDAAKWIAEVGDCRIDCLPGGLTHLWHGDRRHRQYVPRDVMLCEQGFDPLLHLTDDPENGLLSWADAAPAGLRKAVKKYFADRREDG